MKKFCLSLLLFAVVISSAVFISCSSAGESVAMAANTNIAETAECEHVYGEWIITEEADCTRCGLKQRTCTLCGYVDEEQIEQLEHNYETEIVEPTCAEEGYTLHTCTVCSESYKDEYTEALGHDYGEWVLYKDPTCSSNGAAIRECIICGENDMRNTDKLEHEYTAAEVVAPTCTEEGYTVYTCTLCGDSKEQDYTDALGHTYAQTEVPSTCMEEGHILYTCETCGDCYKETISAFSDHDFGEWEMVKQSTCTENGVEIRYCSVCNAYETRETDKKEHQCNTDVISPTCTSEGYTIYTCIECNYSYKGDYTDSLGHTYTQTEVSSTCMEKGHMLYTCETCGYSYKEEYSELSGHNYSEWVNVKEATCSEKGVETRYCLVCQQSETRNTDKLEHNYAEEVISPACTTQGYTKHVCTDCGYSYTDNYIDALGHTYEQTTVYSTCIEEGYILYTCKTCGDCHKEVISEFADHNYGEWVTVEEPTCTENGVQVRTCSVCGNKDTQNIEKLGHDYTDTVISPTCTEGGCTEHTCTRCGNSYKDNYTEATGHSYTAQVIAPTCTEQGYTIYVCHCGDYYIDEGSYTAATGHSYDTGTYCPSTSVDESGYTEYVCFICGYSYKKDDGVYLYTKELDFEKSDDGNYYTVNGITDKSITTIYIPSYYNGLPVTEIAASVFSGNTNIQYVYIGSTVTTIGTNAFYGCTALKYVKMPSSLTTIGDTAFHSCGALESITIPSAVKTIGEKAFYNCTVLQEIYYNAENAYDLGSTDTFAKAGTKADGLIVYISAEVQTIPQNLFYYSTGNIPYITAIIFEENNNCSKIGANAFSGLSKLNYIVLPAGISTLQSGAFGAMGKNTDTIVYFQGTETDWDKYKNLTACSPLVNYCTIYYYSAETPDFTEADTYWHYVDGVITVWAESE